MSAAAKGAWLPQRGPAACGLARAARRSPARTEEAVGQIAAVEIVVVRLVQLPPAVVHRLNRLDMRRGHARKVRGQRCDALRDGRLARQHGDRGVAHRRAEGGEGGHLLEERARRLERRAHLLVRQEVEQQPDARAVAQVEDMHETAAARPAWPALRAVAAVARAERNDLARLGEPRVDPRRRPLAPAACERARERAREGRGQSRRAAAERECARSRCEPRRLAAAAAAAASS